MAYIQNPTWTSSTVLTPTLLNNLETQYDDADIYFLAHNHDTLYYTQTQMQATFWYSGNDGPGSGSDADLLYYASGNKHGNSFAGLGVATGLIIWWYGSVASIPAGWHLCDGTSGTMDLRGKMVPGAGNTYNVGTAGGSTTFTATGTITVDAHVLTINEMAAHTHPFIDVIPVTSAMRLWDHASNYPVDVDITTNTGTTASAGSNSGHTHSGAEGTALNGNAIASMPNYYALCFIQKI
jgi:hypothetical protein